MKIIKKSLAPKDSPERPIAEEEINMDGFLEMDFVLDNGSTITIRKSSHNMLSVRAKNGIAFTVPVGSNGWDIGSVIPADIDKIEGAF